MKTTFIKLAVLFALALGGMVASSPSYAKARKHEYRHNSDQRVLVYRPYTYTYTYSSIDTIYEPPFRND